MWRGFHGDMRTLQIAKFRVMRGRRVVREEVSACDSPAHIWRAMLN
jgi:hypothetical protein